MAVQSSVIFIDELVFADLDAIDDFKFFLHMLFDVDLLLELVGLIFGHRHGVVHDFDDFANLRSTVLERLDLSLQACDLQLKFLDAND